MKGRSADSCRDVTDDDIDDVAGWNRDGSADLGDDTCDGDADGIGNDVIDEAMDLSSLMDGLTPDDFADDALDGNHDDDGSQIAGLVTGLTESDLGDEDIGVNKAAVRVFSIKIQALAPDRIIVCIGRAI